MPPSTTTVPTPSFSELSDRLMPYAEAGDIMGLSARSVRRLVLAGELEAVYVGPRSPRILASSLVRFVSKHTFVPSGAK